MYDVHLKQGTFNYTDKDKIVGLNMNKLLIKILETNTAPMTLQCCSKNNLQILPSYFVSLPASTSNKAYFNIERYITKLLSQLNVMMIPDPCCTRKEVHIVTNVLYFSKEIKGGKDSIRSWLKKQLDFLDVYYQDDCCN